MLKQVCTDGNFSALSSSSGNTNFENNRFEGRYPLTVNLQSPNLVTSDPATPFTLYSEKRDTPIKDEQRHYGTVTETDLHTPTAIITCRSTNNPSRSKQEIGLISSGDASTTMYLAKSLPNLKIETVVTIGTDGLSMTPYGQTIWDQRLKEVESRLEMQDIRDPRLKAVRQRMLDSIGKHHLRPDTTFAMEFNRQMNSYGCPNTYSNPFNEYVNNMLNGEFHKASLKFLKRLFSEIGNRISLYRNFPTTDIIADILPSNYTATAIFTGSVISWGSLHGRPFAFQLGITSNADMIIILDGHILRRDCNAYADLLLAEAGLPPDKHHQFVMLKPGNIYHTIDTVGHSKADDYGLLTFSSLIPFTDGNTRATVLSDGSYNQYWGNNRDLDRPVVPDKAILELEDVFVNHPELLGPVIDKPADDCLISSTSVQLI